MDLLLIILVIIGLASIGRGGSRQFKVHKSEAGKRFLAEHSHSAYERRKANPVRKLDC